MSYSVEPRVELALRRTLFFSLLILVYLIFGASVFLVLPRERFPSKCERNDEKLDTQRSDMLSVLYTESMAVSEHEWERIANQKLDNYERTLLNLCARPIAGESSTTFKEAFYQAFTLITTIGFQEADALTALGKTFAMLYSIIGIPLTLLYLGQCSKALSGMASGNKILTTACVAIFITAIIYDVTEDVEEATPFMDAVFHAFLVLSTVGHCSVRVNGLVIILSVVLLAVVSLSYVILQKHIENFLQGSELSFARWIGRIMEKFGNVISKKTDDDNRILEEAEEETDESE